MSEFHLISRNGRFYAALWLQAGTPGSGLVYRAKGGAGVQNLHGQGRAEREKIGPPLPSGPFFAQRRVFLMHSFGNVQQGMPVLP
ncbi:hypothetical protein GMD83_09135 [Pseudoflavonifractor sp. BIOML-A7]|nr:hypothetical protein [Pseudoflavonifractor sp. BIOML-A7]MTS89614.1 hypothetical protein [Pseudoflavonifractor sp. BIOML-A4]MTS95566.1 hypothetical protein [Pseudoflavonifractor sp. BIOML-A1]